MNKIWKLIKLINRHYLLLLAPVGYCVERRINEFASLNNLDATPSYYWTFSIMIIRYLVDYEKLKT